jgi:hypothetical protein
VHDFSEPLQHTVGTEPCSQPANAVHNMPHGIFSFAALPEAKNPATMMKTSNNLSNQAYRRRKKQQVRKSTYLWQFL